MRSTSPTTDLAKLALTVGILPPLRLRQYSPTSDLPALESICSEVYGGGDYLPHPHAIDGASGAGFMI